jgi:hypothetical protein
MRESLNTRVLQAGLSTLMESIKDGNNYIDISDNDLEEAQLQLDALKNRSSVVKNINDESVIVRISTYDLIKYITNTFNLANKSEIPADSTDRQKHLCFTKLSPIRSSVVAYDKGGHIKHRKSINTILFIDDLFSHNAMPHISSTASMLVKSFYFDGGTKKQVMSEGELITLMKTIWHEVMKRDKRVVIPSNKLSVKLLDIIDDIRKEYE